MTKAFPVDEIRLCYNGVDLEEFQPRRNSRAIRLPIGVVCALRPEKDLRTLIARVRPRQALGTEAVDRRERFHAGRTAFVGRRERLGWRLHFRSGYCARSSEWLHAIDIFVLPSRSEALSNSLLEAMACGCCPVASRVGGNPELIRHGENGMLFEAGDVEQLSDVLETLVELRDTARTAGRQERAARPSSFQWLQSARRMEEIYTELIEASSRQMIRKDAESIAARCQRPSAILRSSTRHRAHWLARRDAQAGFFEQAQRTGGHGLVIVGREQQAVHLIFDDVGNAAGAAGNDGQASGETFQQRERHVVGIRAHEIDVGGVIQRRHLLAAKQIR